MKISKIALTDIVKNVFVIICLLSFYSCTPDKTGHSFNPGQYWLDNNDIHINAHGGGILYYKNKYYWFGEYKNEINNNAEDGITCYSSSDLYNWNNEGIVLAVEPAESGSDIETGCIMERPKVIYNQKTDKFVMFFHLELKGKGYDAARVGIAVADKVSGPYIFQKSLRPNAKCWPKNYEEGQNFDEYLKFNFEDGQMSRDMTLFVDDDGKAYHLFSSENNATLHIALLSDDYQSHTGVYHRLAPGGYNEAPALFKRGNRYYMITSGCTGWAPNSARLFTATDIMGNWKEYPNPCVGENAEKTFHSQSTYVLPVMNKKNAFIFMADTWNPNKPIDGRYVWLPVLFENGLPVLKWMDEWDLDFFSHSFADLQRDISKAKRFLGNVVIGEAVGEFSQEAHDAFQQAIESAKLVKASDENDEIMDAIIMLSNAAATFQDSKIVWELNQLQDGAYYVKVDENKYLTNSTVITWDSHLWIQDRNVSNPQTQLFSIVKQAQTGRYKIVSNLDGRNLNEYICIRHDWNDEDHLWRTVNIYYNGEKYAIQNEGKLAALGIWKYNNQKNAVEPSFNYRLSGDESDFIFSLEKPENHLAYANRDNKLIVGQNEKLNSKYFKNYK